MRISDWSSDVCSSDLNEHPVAYFDGPGGTQVPRQVGAAVADYLYHHNANTHWNYPTSAETEAILEQADRKSVVSGKSVSVRVDLGGRRTIKKKKNTPTVIAKKDTRQREATARK